jgi:membrane-bound lytic murein transglycosylase F
MGTMTRLFLLLLLPLAVSVGTGCQRPDSLEIIQSSGQLTVVTRNGPTTYFNDKTGPTGFEYALASRLAEDLGVELEIRPAFSIKGIFRQLEREKADIAAAGLVLSGSRQASYPHTDPYYRLKPQVIYVAGTRRPRNLEQMAGMKTLVLEGSSHAELLASLAATGHSQLQWQTIPGADYTALLEKLGKGKAQLAIIDSNEFTLLQSLFPRLKVAFDLGEPQELAWYLPPTTENSRLLHHINFFFQRLRDSGELARLEEQHFGHTQGATRIGSHTFNLNMRRKLPEHRELIQRVAAEYQLDWHLLAAIAYQESHWDPMAESPTGVRGMMMLTIPTAREMGVDNRLDARQSLRGGARYLKNIRRRLPDDIFEPDRTWLALAAYNIGMGHLEDARVITERQGGDPHLWQDVMQRLPLLQKSKHYRRTRYGFARGQEAVTYVQNIRHYYNILAWQDIPDNKPLPPLQPAEQLPLAIRNSDLKAL